MPVINKFPDISFLDRFNMEAVTSYLAPFSNLCSSHCIGWCIYSIRAMGAWRLLVIIANV
jgi:hypothetical protein